MRRKTTIYLDESLLRALKTAARRTGQRNYQILEKALGAYLCREALELAGKRSDLTEEEALHLAYRELHRIRRR